MGLIGMRRAVTALAATAAGLGAVAAAEAGKTEKVKTKVTASIGPEGATGAVKSKEKACKKGRTVILSGPEPFDPEAGAESAASHERVKIGSDKSNRKGGWEISAPDGGFFNAGEYEVRVKRKRLGGKRGVSSAGNFQNRTLCRGVELSREA